ncbi:MAG: Rap1a/Tai family immunity protein [Chthoniobacteraceae bacterium]|jgi:hypothetical protein
MIALLTMPMVPCRADPVWATGNTLYEVIGYDLRAHDTGQKLDQYQTGAVCMLLGYLAGFAEASSISAHYDATALPFFLPDDINNDQIERAVYKYLTDNPGKLNMRGDALVVAALAREFPNLTFKPPPGSKN